MLNNGPIIVYDGVCVLCSSWLQFVLKRDKQSKFRFAAMQSDSGRALLRAHGMNSEDPVSFLLLDDDIAYSDTDAVIRVLVSLGGVWRSTIVLRAIPAPVRDAAYRWLARNRYRLFGRRTECLVPSPGTAHRFLR